MYVGKFQYKKTSAFLNIMLPTKVMDKFGGSR